MTYFMGRHKGCSLSWRGGVPGKGQKFELWAEIKECVPVAFSTPINHNAIFISTAKGEGRAQLSHILGQRRQRNHNRKIKKQSNRRI